MSEQDMLDAIGDMFGKMGISGFEFVDEHGAVQAHYDIPAPKLPTWPLRSYGDPVSVGDRVVVGHWSNSETGGAVFTGVEFNGDPVTILNYGGADDPFMLVDHNGQPTSFNYDGNGFYREFRKVGGK